MKKVMIFAAVMIVGLIIMCVINHSIDESIPYAPRSVYTMDDISAKPKKEKAPQKPEPKYILTEDEYADLAKLVWAEARGEDDKGKKLVIDSVLNRKDHPDFPDTVHDVIWQSGQYYTVDFDTIGVDKDIIKLINEELIEKTDDRVIFFRTGRYSDYGTPLYKHGGHYFSSLPVSD